MLNMNICFVESGYPSKGFGGGAGTYVQLTAKELVRRGHKAFVISKYLDGEPEESMDGGVVIRRARIKGWHWYFTKVPIIGRTLARFFKIVESSLAVNSQIKRLHKEHELDMVEFPETANFLYPIQIKLPYIIHLHGSDFTVKKYCKEEIHLEDRLQRWLEGILTKRADLITAPSKFLKEEIVREFKIDSSRISVIPYPINRELLTSPIRFNEDARDVYYAGRLEKRKGVDVLLKSIPLVVESAPETRFWFFGSFSQEISLEKLKTYLKKNGVEKNVRIHPHIPRTELLNVARDLDICVLPTIFDNSPYVIYEAMALGKAIVSTRSPGGIPELIDDGKDGVLVRPGDTAGLVNAILGLLKDERRRNNMGHLARENAARCYDVERITNKHISIYCKIKRNDDVNNL